MIPNKHRKNEVNHFSNVRRDGCPSFRALYCLAGPGGDSVPGGLPVSVGAESETVPRPTSK